MSLLRTDEQGRAIVRQSDLASASYCGLRQWYDHEAAGAGQEGRRLSATILGTVKHYALQVFQKLDHEGREDAEQVALATFEYYWSPEHCHEISEGFPNEWIRGHTWASDLAEGLKSLKAAFDWARRDRAWLLGIEHTFNVPHTLPSGEEIIMHGTVDRLTLRTVNATPTISSDDWKSGLQVPDHLYYATQWSFYSWASLQPEFWALFYEADSDGFDNMLRTLEAKGVALHRGHPSLEPAPRRGRLLSVKGGTFKAHDAGERNPYHYRRLDVHIMQYLAAVRGGFHQMTTDTKKCAHCPWAKICGGAPLPPLPPGAE